MLIEVLVSILIFSIGVLALVGLQAKMTRAQTMAKARADAAYLANELIGVMWSDINNLSSYGNCASYARCNDWLTKVATNLPAGSATVTTSGTGLVQITIRWTQSSEPTHNYITTTYVKTSS